MKCQLALRFKKYVLASAVTSVLFFGGGAAPAMAVNSSPTGSVMGRAPTLTPGNLVWSDKSGTGVVDVGDELSIDPSNQFIFDDLDGDKSIGDTYEWRVGDQVLGVGPSYTITAADLGKTIRLFVTPHTDPLLTDPYEGLAVEANNTFVVAAAGAVYAASISGFVNGAPEVGTELNAVVSCVNGACDLNNLAFQWQIEKRDAVTGSGAGEFVDIPDATSATLTPTKDMQKLRVQVVVTNK